MLLQPPTFTLLQLRSSPSAPGLCCSPDTCFVHTVSHLCTSQAEQTVISTSLLIQDADIEPSHASRGDGRAALTSAGQGACLGPAPGAAASPGHFSPSHRIRIPLAAEEPPRGDSDKVPKADNWTYKKQKDHSAENEKYVP